MKTNPIFGTEGRGSGVKGRLAGTLAPPVVAKRCSKFQVAKVWDGSCFAKMAAVTDRRYMPGGMVLGLAVPIYRDCATPGAVVVSRGEELFEVQSMRGRMAQRCESAGRMSGLPLSSQTPTIPLIRICLMCL